MFTHGTATDNTIPGIRTSTPRVATLHPQYVQIPVDESPITASSFSDYNLPARIDRDFTAVSIPSDPQSTPE